MKKKKDSQQIIMAQGFEFNLTQANLCAAGISVRQKN